jgi:hypothetical protein
MRGAFLNRRRLDAQAPSTAAPSPPVPIDYEAERAETLDQVQELLASIAIRDRGRASAAGIEPPPGIGRCR